MKKNNEDLLKLKVEIFITKNYVYDIKELDRLYQNVALLVDKPIFLSFIAKTRKKLHIKLPIINVSKLDEKTRENVIRSKFHVYKFMLDNKDKEEPLNKEADKIIQFFYYPNIFKDIVLQTILFGFVFTSMPLVDVIDKYDHFYSPQVAIFPNPDTTNDDIKKALRFSKLLFKYNKDIKVRKFPDYYPNIRVMRQWYWERLEEKTYQKIADDYAEPKLPAQYNTTYRDVIKGVKIYKKLLTL